MRLEIAIERLKAGRMRLDAFYKHLNKASHNQLLSNMPLGIGRVMTRPQMIDWFIEKGIPFLLQGESK